MHTYRLWENNKNINSDCVHMNRYMNFYKYVIHYMKALTTSWGITYVLVEAKGIRTR